MIEGQSRTAPPSRAPAACWAELRNDHLAGHRHRRPHGQAAEDQSCPLPILVSSECRDGIQSDARQAGSRDPPLRR